MLQYNRKKATGMLSWFLDTIYFESKINMKWKRFSMSEWMAFIGLLINKNMLKLQRCKCFAYSLPEMKTKSPRFINLFQ